MYEVGYSIDFREAIMLTALLKADTTSWYASAVYNWSRPFNPIEDRLSDLVELTANLNRRKGSAPLHIDRPYEKKQKAHAVPVDVAREYFKKKGHATTHRDELPAGFLPEK